MTRTLEQSARALRRTCVLVVLVTAMAACAAEDQAAPAAEDQGGATEAEARTVSTVLGDVEVPASAERIVTTHNIATQPLVDLGVEPVGIGDLPEEAAYPDYWEAIADLPQLGNGIEVDIEQVASLDPDLIFAINAAPEETLERLAAIAPLVVIGIEGPQRADWQGRVELVAEATGRSDDVPELADRYDERAEEIATTYADTLAEETFVVLDSFEQGAVIPYGPDSMVGEVLQPAGIRFAPSASSELVAGIADSPDQSVSAEQLGEVTDGSVILHGALPSTAQPSATQQELLDSALLQASEAAQAGDVYPIGKTLIASYGDALACLDLLDAALAELERG